MKNITIDTIIGRQLLIMLSVCAVTPVDVVHQRLHLLHFETAFARGITLPNIQRQHDDLQKYGKHDDRPTIVADPAVHPFDQLAHYAQLAFGIIEEVRRSLIAADKNSEAKHRQY